uniref:CPG4 domain-containing protein n=1 Tax=Macrostomum lignano TaxID=282301 RepID=A0A1I8GH05_9PLAT
AQSHQSGTLGRPKLDCQLLFRSASGSSIGHSLAAFGSLEAVEPFNNFADCMKTGSNICTESADMSCSDAEAVALTILDRAEDCLVAADQENDKTEAANFRLQWSMAALATTASSAFSDDASRDPVLGCVQAALRDGSAAPLRGLIRGSGSDDSSGLGLALQVC